MVNTIESLDSGLRVGHVGLGYRGDVAGSVRQEVHDGDTVKTKPIGNLSIRFLGVDTPEISFQFPGRKEFIGLSNQLWTDFLADPFNSVWNQPTMDAGLLNHLKQKIGQDTAKNHYKHALAAERRLEEEVLNDIGKLGQTKDNFQFFLAFADEIMDRYGRLLSYVNRDQPIATIPEPRPRPYNERLLKDGLASPYFIFPNVSPFNDNALEDNKELAPSKFRNKVNQDQILQTARKSVIDAQKEPGMGIFEKNDPLKIQPFEIRFLAQRRLPNRWIIDLSKNDDNLIEPQKYYLINLEDRLYVPYRFVPLFVDSGWKVK
jgi:endonuclease YncB( thermonuclease family)